MYFLPSKHIRFVLSAMSITMITFACFQIKCALDKQLLPGSLSSHASLTVNILEKLNTGATQCQKVCAFIGPKMGHELLHCGLIMGLNIITDYAWQEIKHVIQEEIYPGYSDFDRKEYFTLSDGPNWFIAGLLSLPIMHAARAGSMPKLNARDLLLPSAKILGGRAACWSLLGFMKVVFGRRNTQYSSKNSNILRILGEPSLVCIGTCAWIIHKRYSCALT